jgi:hypothetical protein
VANDFGGPTVHNSAPVPHGDTDRRQDLGPFLDQRLRLDLFQKQIWCKSEAISNYAARIPHWLTKYCQAVRVKYISSFERELRSFGTLHGGIVKRCVGRTR